jgi:RNA polymerase sigma factor (sigma-70 family)
LDSKQLNKIVEIYQRTRDNDLFSIIYRDCIPVTNVLRKIAASIHVDVHDLVATYEDKLMECVKKFDGKSDFRNFFNFSVRNARCDKLRQSDRREQKEMLESQLNRNDSSGQSMFDLIISRQLIDTREKVRDQLALITYLMRESDDDRISTIISVALDDTSGRLSPTAIGRITGIKPDTVSRCIRKLANYYNHELFGDYHDYLSC